MKMLKFLLNKSKNSNQEKSKFEIWCLLIGGGLQNQRREGKKEKLADQIQMIIRSSINRSNRRLTEHLIETESFLSGRSKPKTKTF